MQTIMIRWVWFTIIDKICYFIFINIDMIYRDKSSVGFYLFYKKNFRFVNPGTARDYF